MARFRVVLALALALLITAALAMIILACAVPFTFFIGPFVSHNPFRRLPEFWGRMLTECCLKRLMRVSVCVDGHVRDISEQEKVIIIANHPSTLALPVFFALVTTRIASRFTIVLKRELLANPFIGLPMKAIESAVFVDRSRHEQAILSIRGECARTEESGSRVFILFPDRTRPTEAHIQKDRRAIKAGFLYTTSPKSGGLMTVLQEQPGARIIDITIAPSVAENGLRDAKNLFGQSIHVRFEDVTGKVRAEKEALRTWLMDHWQKKNTLISLWRTNAANRYPGGKAA